MSIGFQTWIALAGFIGLIWLARAVAIEFALRRRIVLHSKSYPGPPKPAPRVSIVLAARDEERNIEECVTTLLAQDYSDVELIVVDDRSSDRTPVILQRLVERHPDRLRVLRVESLPDGWFGKHHAVHFGVAASNGDWLLFTDADCRQTSPNTLSMALREAMEHEADFLSIIPTLEPQTIWDRFVQPVCTVVLMSWFRPGSVNNPASKTAYANGAFMLVSRSCYDAIGGHAAVRTRINEDVQLARLAKQRGHRLRVVENRGLYVTRMYDNLAGLFHGWSRIFFGSFERPPAVVAALTMISVSVVLPWVFLLIAAIGRWTAPPPSQSAWTLAFLAWFGVVVLVQAVTGRLFVAVGFGAKWSLLYAAGAFVTMAILLNSLIKSLGWTPTTWRTTNYARGFSRQTGGPESTGVATHVERMSRPVAQVEVSLPTASE